VIENHRFLAEKTAFSATEKRDYLVTINGYSAALRTSKI